MEICTSCLVDSISLIGWDCHQEKLVYFCQNCKEVFLVEPMKVNGED